MKRIKNTVRRVTAMVMAAVLLWTAQPADVSAANVAKGVDVSKYNGAIDWNQAKSAGIDFAFIKIGSTKSGIDPNFATNIAGAQAAGIRTGVYVYSYATTPEAAIREANLVLEWIDGYTVNYPIVFDIEDKCQRKLSQEQLISIINSFCMTIEAAGYYPMVYSYKSMFDGKLNICGWDRWVAHYNENCGSTNNVCVWQYTSKGRVAGFGGNVDLNYQYKDYNSLIISEGFTEHNGNTRFYRNWRMQKGWVEYNNTKYYLDGAGNLVRGWFTDEAGAIYYLTPQDGSIARGQCAVDGAEFFFNADGVRQTGFVTLETGTSYYDAATGQKLKGWINLGDQTFFADEAGHIVTGVYTIENQPYYFGADGVLVKNQAVELDSVPYVTTSEGVLTPVVVAPDPTPETVETPAIPVA